MNTSQKFKKKQSSQIDPSSLFSPDQTMNIHFYTSARKKNQTSQKSGVTNKSKYTNNSKLLKSQLFSTISRTNKKMKNQLNLIEKNIQIQLLQGSLENMNFQQKMMYQKILKYYQGWAKDAQKMCQDLKKMYH